MKNKYCVPYEEKGELLVKLFPSLSRADEFRMKFNRSNRPYIYAVIQ
jgi:hypothetical protein